MKKTKKSLISIFMVCVIIIMITTISAIASQSAEKKVIAAEWSYIDDNYYSVFDLGSGETILIRRMQDRDYDQISEKLIDHSIKPDTELAAIVASDPNAILPDNMLPDGSYLIEDWSIQYEKLLNEATGVKKLIYNQNGQASVKELSTSSYDFSKKSTAFTSTEIHKISSGQSSIFMPINFDSGNEIFQVAPDKQSVFYISDSQIARVDSKGNVKVISPSTFDGKTYEQISKESVEKYGENYAFWNGQVQISPSSSTAVYVSNKGDIGGTWDLFTLDLNTGNEVKIANDLNMHYFVDSWLDSNHIICIKTANTKYEVVIVDTEGKEYAVDFAVEKPIILGARDGVIVYGSENCDTIWFAKFDQSNSLKRIGEIKLNGTYRTRLGVDPFSPDGTKFAYLFVPSENDYGRDVVIVDINTLNEYKNQTIPIGTKGDAAVLEFNWLDNNRMFTSVIVNETQEISSWIYNTK